MTASSPQPAHGGIQRQVLILTAIRTIINTANRMMYPFLAVFARGLGVDLASISMVVSARSFIAALNPLLAPVIERRGRKTGMLIALGLFVMANTLIFLFPTLPVFMVGMCINGLSMYIIYSAVHAFIGDQIPYATRGRSAATLELSWSLSFLLGVPLASLLIGAAGWRAPFPVFVVLGLLSFLVLLRAIPRPNPAHNQRMDALTGLKSILRSPAAVSGLAFSVVLTVGNEAVNLVFGVWLEDSFGLKIAALGAAAIVIGLADLLAEMLSASLVDRLGKQRSIALGLAGVLISSLALPWLSGTVWAALGGLFFFFFCFEFVVVSFLPLMSEVLPKARATLMAYDVTAHALGRGLGALFAAGLYAAGLYANTLVAAGCTLLALLLLRRVTVPEG